MVSPVSIGVDNGGTWIRLKGLDSRGRCVWSLKKQSPPVGKLPFFLKKHLKRFESQLSYLAVGSKGVWKQAKRRAVKRALKGLAKNIVVMSDVEAAWHSVFKSEGILIISGTGSIAYGRRSDGRFARAGGLGPLEGDEGSGYWIGKEWLRRSGRADEWMTKGSVRQIAALAPKVLRLARRKNVVACGIIDEAQKELAALVMMLAKNFRLKKVPLSVAGSILENKAFQKGFIQLLRRQKIRFTFVRRRLDAATALAKNTIMDHASR